MDGEIRTESGDLSGAGEGVREFGLEAGDPEVENGGYGMRQARPFIGGEARGVGDG